MKILIYGTGVIGSCLGHSLLLKNDVTFLARGKRLQELQENGLVLFDYLHKKEIKEKVHAVEKASEEQFDVVFITLQSQQAMDSLESVSTISSSRYVFVGNDFFPKELQEQFLSFRKDSQVYFGFLSVGGQRREGRIEYCNFNGEFTFGKLQEEMTQEEKEYFLTLSSGIPKKEFHFAFMDNMEAWLMYHLAFILPFAYLTYEFDYDLKKAKRKDRKEFFRACEECYSLLTELGYPIRPKGDEKAFQHGIYGLASRALVYFMCKTKYGDYCVTEHCRNAVKEMQYFSECMEKIRERKKDFPLSTYEKLKKKSGLMEK